MKRGRTVVSDQLASDRFGNVTCGRGHGNDISVTYMRDETPQVRCGDCEREDADRAYSEFLRSLTRDQLIGLAEIQRRSDDV
jgi:hypothetical protein